MKHNVEASREKEASAMFPNASLKGLFTFMGMVVLCFGAVVQPACAAQSNAEDAERQARVEAAMDAGKAAAKRGDWLKAAEQFEKAQYGSSYPAPPAVYFNIALANDRVGGREFKAMGFYRAYLTLSPQARNGAAIEQRLVELQQMIRHNALQLMELIERAALEFPEKSLERVSGLKGVWAAKAFLGDPSLSLKDIQQQTHGYRPESTYRKIAEALGHKGDFEAALKFALIPPNRDAFTISALSALKIDQGDIDGAQAIIERIEEVIDHAEADIRATTSDHTDEATVQKLVENKRQNAIWVKAKALHSLILHLINYRDDPVQARRLAVRVDEMLPRLTKVDLRNRILPQMVNVWLYLAEIEKAEKIALSIPAGDGRSSAYVRLSTHQMAFGHLKAARRALAKVSSNKLFAMDRSRIKKQIGEMDKAMARRDRSATIEQRKEAIQDMLDLGYRPLAPYRRNFTVEGVASYPWTAEHQSISDWTVFGSVSSVGITWDGGANEDFKSFMSKLQGMTPPMMMSAASNAVLAMLAKLGKYRRLDVKHPIGGM